MAFFFSWGLAGAEAAVVTVKQVMVLGSNVSLSFYQDANLNIKLKVP